MKVLLIDSTHPLLESSLREAGHEVVEAFDWPLDRILGILPEYHGVVIRSRIPVDRTFLDAASKLKCIGRFGAGLENIDVEYAASKGISCLNVPEGNRRAVAEHSLGLLLNLMNHMRRADNQVRQGIWDRHGNTGTELTGKTVGIIGFGNMGRDFARVLRGFDVNVIAYDPYLSPWPEEPQANAVSLGELQQQADVVSMHVPLTDETRGMADARFFSSFSKPIFFLNTARGPVVSTAALIEAIEQNKVIAAGLDVLEYESKAFAIEVHDNPVFQSLVGSDRVLLSPHVAGWTDEAFAKMGKFLGEKMNAALKS